jgi:hypothetical protein
MTKHNTCSHSDTNFHPTRLLDVGDINSQTVRVEVMPTDINSGARYATLSHRWGKSKVLRLTTSTMLRLQAGIPTAELAKTFQDAIFISRQLGITRLWIDSLCIVQDSKEDWERESSQMSNVYRHAVINVAASAAPDSARQITEMDGFSHYPNRMERPYESQLSHLRHGCVAKHAAPHAVIEASMGCSGALARPQSPLHLRSGNAVGMLWSSDF